MPSKIHMAFMFKTFPSSNPVVNMQPRITKIIETIFLDVSFSLISIYASIIAKMGAELKSTAANDKGMLFMASL